MKIMFCIGSMAQGGAERVIANLSNKLSQKNEVSVVSTVVGKPFYTLKNKVKYYTLDNDNKKENIIKRTVKRIKNLRKIIKEEKPDIAVAFLPEPTFRLMIAKSFLNIKTIISVRNDPKVLYNTFLKKMIVKIFYSSADGFVFQTEDAKKWFSNRIQSKSKIIPNPINENFICKPFMGVRDKSIVCVARLVKQKNHKMLINAFNKVIIKHSEYSLKLYGEGPCKESLINQVKELNLESKVIFMGEVSNIKDEIYRSGIFVLPSDYEGMPNALMEAMALGIPCVATDCPCGGPRFLIENGKNGLLFDIGDENGLIDSLNLLIENEELSKNIGLHANEICYKLAPSKINIEWENYILEVTNEKK